MSPPPQKHTPPASISEIATQDAETPGPNTDWEQVAATTIDGPFAAVPEAQPEPVPQEVTKPNDLVPVLAEARSRGYDIGFRKGFDKGREAVFEVLQDAFTTFKQPDDVAAHVAAWIRARLPPV